MMEELEMARQLGALQERLRAHIESSNERIEDLENERQKNREWKRGPALLATMAALTIIANIIVTIALHK